ncbi:MAG: hypothetical protein AAF624_10395 [Bacteroidota bacterium]
MIQTEGLDWIKQLADLLAKVGIPCHIDYTRGYIGSGDIGTASIHYHALYVQPEHEAAAHQVERLLVGDAARPEVPDSTEAAEEVVLVFTCEHDELYRAENVVAFLEHHDVQPVMYADQERGEGYIVTVPTAERERADDLVEQFVADESAAVSVLVGNTAPLLSPLRWLAHVPVALSGFAVVWALLLLPLDTPERRVRFGIALGLLLVGVVLHLGRRRT